MMTTDAIVPKVFLGYAASTLTTICNAIDNGADLDETMLELFDTTAHQLSEGFERRKAVARSLKAAIEHTKAYEKQVNDHRKKLESALSRLKSMTKEIVEANPDIPFKDSLGKKLTIVKNSKPGVNYDFELGTKSVRNIMPEGCGPFNEADIVDYVKTEEVLTLDTGKVMADLVAGVELPWARLAQGYHLRGL
jgi:hypothetical protein